MIRLLVMLASAVAVVWLANRLETADLHAGARALAGRVAERLRVVSPLGSPTGPEVVAKASPPEVASRSVAAPGALADDAPAAAEATRGSARPGPEAAVDVPPVAAAPAAPEHRPILSRDAAQRIRSRLDRVMALGSGAAR